MISVYYSTMYSEEKVFIKWPLLYSPYTVDRHYFSESLRLRVVALSVCTVSQSITCFTHSPTSSRHSLAQPEISSISLALWLSMFQPSSYCGKCQVMRCQMLTYVTMLQAEWLNVILARPVFVSFAVTLDNAHFWYILVDLSIYLIGVLCGKEKNSLIQSWPVLCWKETKHSPEKPMTICRFLSDIHM